MPTRQDVLDGKFKEPPKKKTLEAVKPEAPKPEPPKPEPPKEEKKDAGQPADTGSPKAGV
jgi:hypothetical protein